MNDSGLQADIKAVAVERQWVAQIIKSGGCCWLCGLNEFPLIIQQHHIAGKYNSDLTIPVCPNCHSILNMGQKSWPKDWTKQNNSPRIRRAIMLKGLAELDKMKAMIMSRMSEEILTESD